MIHSKKDTATFTIILDAIAEYMGPNFRRRVLLIDDAEHEIKARHVGANLVMRLHDADGALRAAALYTWPSLIALRPTLAVRYGTTVQGVEACQWYLHGMVYLLCIWHVLRCWVKALRFKVANKAHRHALFMLIQKIMYGTKQRVRHPHPCGRVRLCLRAIEFPTLMRRSHRLLVCFPPSRGLHRASPRCRPARLRASHMQRTR